VGKISKPENMAQEGLEKIKFFKNMVLRKFGKICEQQRL
jgi:hypothetical protein